MIKIIASFFYIGFLPLMSGTYASLGGLAIFYMLKGNRFLLNIITALIVFIGFIVCGMAEKVLEEKDSSKIVIDEVSGMLLCCCFIPADIFYLIGAFILFRFFDIVKPFPINEIQSLKGSMGIMLDDIAAAGYALIVLHAIVYFYKLIF